MYYNTSIFKICQAQVMIRLPNKKDLIVSNEEDPLKFYYLPIARSFYKKRLIDVLNLLGDGKYENLLDIGFGSGILFPELSKKADNLYGLETHGKIKEVSKLMIRGGIRTNLIQGSILEMPYENGFFDAVVSVSTMEHIVNLDEASNEIVRVLKLRGVLVLGFPVRNKFTDFLFKMCGKDPRKIHPSSHIDILNMFNGKMKQERLIYLPEFFPMYISVRFFKK